MIDLIPLSRAETHILQLANRTVGYDPNEDGPWWVWVFRPLAFHAIRRLWREGLLQVTREASGRALIRATLRGAVIVEQEQEIDAPPE